MTDVPALVEIVTTVATEEAALEIARALVRERLVACASFAPCRSVYRWRGAVQEEAEVQVALKTTADRADEAERRLRELHAYETPAILRAAVRATPDYARWVVESVAPGRESAP